jgi:hypothetical protein
LRVETIERLDMLAGCMRSVKALGRFGAVPQNPFAAKLAQALVEKLASKRRRANAPGGGLSIEQPPLLGVQTDRNGISHVVYDSIL